VNFDLALQNAALLSRLFVLATGKCTESLPWNIVLVLLMTNDTTEKLPVKWAVMDLKLS